MSEGLALIRHRRPEQPLAWQNGQLITAAQYLADVRSLARLLPRQATAVVNAFEDRYHFAVGLGAALLSGKQSVLPHNHVERTVAQIAERFDGLHCMGDAAALAGLPFTFWRRDPASPAAPSSTRPSTLAPSAMASFDVPRIEADRLAAWLFTSGSTGDAVAHPRSWSSITRSAIAEAQRLGLDGPSASMAILATVPAQHSYGFESAICLPLLGGGELVAERPFYPADIQREIERLPRPRMLVTSPMHLRVLLAHDGDVPAIDLLLSATAPLPPADAQLAEQRFGGRLMEIYGSTESGQVASRRTTSGQAWQPLAGITVSMRDDRAHASGGHLDEAIALSDHIDPRPDGSFLLGARLGDMINIAGKRSSVAFIESQLRAIDGVQDAALLMLDPDSGQAATQRLTGFVVAPTVDARTLMRALGERIDRVFLPRPLHWVPSLPRDGNGKVQRRVLVEMARSLAVRSPRDPASPRVERPNDASKAP